jgi:catechol 2,3-dioxygenase-like lactoylglutathione lyase family enzyme
MKLNHLNLTVTDVRAASAFLEKYFGMRSTGGNAGMAFLTEHAYTFYGAAPGGFTVELGA